MVVVDRVARDVRVLTAGQVESLHGAKPDQDVERAEDRGPPDAEPAAPRVIDEVGRGEVPLAIGDQVRDGTPCGRGPVAGPAEGLDW